LALRAVVLCSIAALSAGPLHAASSCHGELANADSAIRIEADERGPRLTRLTLRGASPWINGTDESLPSQVEANGAPRSVQWQLNPTGCRVASARIQLVYDSYAPRLRLTWEWRRRSIRGPLRTPYPHSQPQRPIDLAAVAAEFYI
jgi:hypothetical protein